MIDNSMRAILDWQKRLREKQGVWTVTMYESGYGWESTGNVYASREAAQVEIDWYKRVENKTAKLQFLGHLLDEQLSQERWT